MPSRTTNVYLDRFEEDFGVFLESDAEGVEFDIPRRLLPEGAREGMRFTLTLTTDEEATEAGKQRVAGLMAELLHRE